MQLQTTPSSHLTYCLNVHPGETWAEQFAAIRTHAVGVRDRVSGTAPFGLGLRISAQAAETLQDSAARAELKTVLCEQRLYVFTINGFPYGRFHGGRVKEQVYLPDWRDPARREYTLNLARLLAELLEEGTSGSISTVPCAYKTFARNEADQHTMAEELALTVKGLADLMRTTGREIHLGLEPEPACLIETTDDFLSFYKTYLLGTGRTVLMDRMSIAADEAEQLLRRHLGVCLDTCHAALQFEEPGECWDRYEAEGVRVSKIQLSAALEVTNTEEARTALRPFDEPVYLHQTRARTGDGTVLAWPDLPDALAALPHRPDTETVRIHFHVPLHWAGTAPLRTTGVLLDESFWARLRAGACDHLEIETYTYDVLPDSLKSATIEDSIAQEWAWVMGRLDSEVIP